MPERFAGFTPHAIGQAIIESFSTICVNCFLVITGWYGLKLKWKHVLTIWSVLVFVYIPSYLYSVYCGEPFLIRRLVLSIIAVVEESYYVQCYLMLMFLSPVLNSYIEKYGRSILPWVVAFWMIEIILGFVLRNVCLGFGKGYELTHFVFLYLLMQALRLNYDRFRKWVSLRNVIGILIIGILSNTIMYIVVGNRAFDYTNPITVVMSIALFLIFEKYYFFNGLVNRIAASTLMVYIMHVSFPVIGILIKWDNYVLRAYSYLSYLGIISLTIIAVLIVGVLYDQIRIFVMTPINKKLEKYLSHFTAKYIVKL